LQKQFFLFLGKEKQTTQKHFENEQVLYKCGCRLQIKIQKRERAQVQDRTATVKWQPVLNQPPLKRVYVPSQHNTQLDTMASVSTIL
jgi:hypothetical protein